MTDPAPIIPPGTQPPIIPGETPTPAPTVQVTPLAPAPTPAPAGVGPVTPANMPTYIITPPPASAAHNTNKPSHQFLVLMEGAAISALGGGATGILAGVGGLTGDKVMSSDAWLAFAAAVGVSALHTLAAWIVTKTTNRS